MLGMDFYNHSVIRKYNTVFGTLFNDIYIHRENSSGTKLQIIPVPIHLASSSKHVAMDEKNPITTKVQTQLPRMSYVMTGINLAKDRNINTLNKSVKILNDSTMRIQYAEVPVNLEFELRIYTKSADDMHQIIGQIIPFFQQDFTPTVRLVDEMDLKFDTKVILNSISPNDDFDGDPGEPRIVQWILNFTMYGYFFGPVSSQGVIKRAIVDLIPVPGSGEVTGDEINIYGRKVRITMTPGLTANGTPTSTANNSIPYTEINADDNYGIIETIDDFVDGRKWNPKTGLDE